MEKSILPRRSGPLLAVMAMGAALCPGAATAAGVTAGTLIQNNATATYTSGAAGGTIQSNTVTVRVDELLGVAVASLSSSPIATGSATAVLPFTITNTGNGSEAFKLTANPSVGGNPYDTVVQGIVIDINANGTYDPGIDQALTGGGQTTEITEDGALTVFVLVTLPAGATDTATSQIRLTAEAATGTGTPGTVIAGQGGGGGDAVVGSTGATANALASVTASLASVSLVKSAAIVDPFGGTAPVPGALVTYTIVASVSGTGEAETLHVTDTVPAGTTYQPGTLHLDATAMSDAADGDAGTASASGIDVALGTVAGGASHTIAFGVRIN
jgi:uncharacterized repeat protein (TIGR01451 family)